MEPQGGPGAAELEGEPQPPARQLREAQGPEAESELPHEKQPEQQLPEAEAAEAADEAAERPQEAGRACAG